MSLPNQLQRAVVPTPRELAAAMVRSLGDHPTASWLEPCVGEGSFLEELSAIGVSPKRVTAVDIEAAPNSNDCLAQTIRGLDFCRWACTTGQRFDRIAANPPYVSIGTLTKHLIEAALAVPTPDLPKITRKSNYWVAFLIACLRVLNRGGSIGFVLPASWEHADYAADLRSKLPLWFQRFEVHRCKRPLFTSVADGCVVILGHGYKCAPDTAPTRTEHETPAALISTLRHPSDHVAPWPVADSCSTTNHSSEDGLVRVKDIFEISIGGVTGDTNFFLLTESERLLYGLPVNSLRPVLSRARQLVCSEMTHQDWTRLRHAGERVWLFHPSDSDLVDSRVTAYLASGKGGTQYYLDRYKVRQRSPWYRTILRDDVDGFLSGMTKTGPWLCLNAMKDLNATNTLYVFRFHEKSSIEQMAAWAISFSTTATRSQLAKIGRIYADGLIKYEPGSLKNLRMRRPTRTDGARHFYSSVVNLFIRGEIDEAQQLADSWMGLDSGS